VRWVCGGGEAGAGGAGPCQQSSGRRRRHPAEVACVTCGDFVAHDTDELPAAPWTRAAATFLSLTPPSSSISQPRTTTHTAAAMGNGNKANMKRERNAKNAAASEPKSQLKANRAWCGRALCARAMLIRSTPVQRPRSASSAPCACRRSCRSVLRQLAALAGPLLTCIPQTVRTAAVSCA
jgi:hypothetical protein